MILFLSRDWPASWYNAVGASSISRWIKKLLEEAGVDTTVYSAHSTKGASASKAAASGVAIENILRAGGWASESVFQKHYRRQVDEVNMSSAVLSRSRTSV